ncbi:hypothetical protein SBV1_1620012 [Verrucomicrobia bacterium]|nr:hypothetical protein SBV1_1620012 [Verrucomicrobiota bacterium]
MRLVGNGNPTLNLVLAYAKPWLYREIQTNSGRPSNPGGASAASP